jgi:hypothetical protein
MKLPVAARDLLRKTLREHPDIERHIQPPDHIEQMKKRELLALAKNLRINVRNLIEEVERDNPGPSAALEEDIALARYSSENPAFSGTLEFDLDIGVFGKKISRKARIVWEYTPAWEYFDPRLQRVHEGWPGDCMHVEVFSGLEREVWVPGPDGELHPRDKSPQWRQFDLTDLFEDGVAPPELLGEIEDRIDEMARREDAIRRASRRSRKSPKDGSISEKDS